MEALRNLEQVQRILSLIHHHGLSSNHHDSDRFLADFFLFMAKPSGTLNVNKKYDLISEILPKISPSIFDEALLSLDKQELSKNQCVEEATGCLVGIDQQNNAGYPTGFCVGQKSNFCSNENDIEDMPTIELEAMQRANSTLEDFCRSYFMFHGMDVCRPESIFRYLPVLSFTESYIYQLDSLNEEVLSITEKIGIGTTCKTRRSQRLSNDFLKVLKTGPFRPLVILLERHGFLTERIRFELSCGEEYWALERKLCNALVSKKEILIDDVMRAIHLKSFDYRVLNLLLYQLSKTQVNEKHMEFLSISEFLVEISDDLYDYEEDVIENSFNILRLFVGVYGASVAPVMLAKCITEGEEKYEQLLKTLDPELSLNYMRRCEEATKEGGNRAGHSLGTWSMPRVIADEEFYRSERLSGL